MRRLTLIAVALALLAVGRLCWGAMAPNFVIRPGDPWFIIPDPQTFEPQTNEQRHQLAVAFWKDYLCARPELVSVLRDAMPAAEANLRYLQTQYPERY